MKIVMFDAGISNVHSMSKALREADSDVEIRTDLALLSSADAVVLPGVGAFGPAASALGAHRDVLRTSISDGMPVLGVCLGMQLLFNGSAESPGEGLGVLAGQVTTLPTRQRPHMGWNRVEAVAGGAPLELGWAYFAHSYACLPADPASTWATTTHGGVSFASAVRAGSLWGVQFHPEKSSRPGIDFLRRFLREARCA